MAPDVRVPVGDSPGEPREIAILVFDGVQSLDVTGPLEVFAQAVEVVRKRGGRTPYSIELLAERAGMSAQNFARVVRRESGCTPGKYVERARVDAARASSKTAASRSRRSRRAVGSARASRCDGRSCATSAWRRANTGARFRVGPVRKAS
jgi:transcriptional regulator GlxA family with amidase domain